MLNLVTPKEYVVELRAVSRMFCSRLAAEQGKGTIAGEDSSLNSVAGSPHTGENRPCM